MKDAQKPDIGRPKEGRYVIPDFQREFEWRPWDVRDMMRSIFLDYHIGSQLLWKGTKSNFDAVSCEGIYGCKGTGNRERRKLGPPQLRLTSNTGRTRRRSQGKWRRWEESRPNN
jgi:hypothetical protein